MLGSEIGGHTVWMTYMTYPDLFEQGIHDTVIPMVQSFHWIGP